MGKPNGTEKKNKFIFRAVLVPMDLALVNLGYLLAFWLKFGWKIPEDNFAAYLSTCPWLTLAAMALLYFYRLYSSYRWRWTEVFASLVCVVFFQGLAAMAVTFFLRGFSFPRTVLLLAPLIQLALLSLWRRAAWHVERRLENPRRVVVVGQPSDALALADKLEAAPGGILKVAGLVVENGEETDDLVPGYLPLPRFLPPGSDLPPVAGSGTALAEAAAGADLAVKVAGSRDAGLPGRAVRAESGVGRAEDSSGAGFPWPASAMADARRLSEDYHRLCNILGRWPVLGGVAEFCECLDAVRPDQVFVCSALSPEAKAEVVYACVARDRNVFLVPGLYEIMLAQARLDQVDDVPVFTVGRLAIPEEAKFVKRATDILISLATLVAAAPLFALVATAVRLDSPGPVFYRQKRLTLQGKPFYLYKFRTMVADAERESGPVLASENDPRVTRVGRFLRATRIDELPQLLNVLKGNMSIVGPRPERPSFVDELMKETPEYVYRMNIKSGITGLAQIAGRYSTSPENKLKYDLLYTKSYSPARDLAILLQTVKVILMKDRAS